MPIVLYYSVKIPSKLHLLTGNSVSEEFELTLPEDVVEGSARASISVLGKTKKCFKKM